MTVEGAQAVLAEIEDRAFNGEPMPSGLKSPEQIAFLKFRYLYQYAKMVQMSGEQGRREKHEILKQYVVDAFNSDLMQATAERWKATELAHSEYRKNRSLENADKLSALLDGLK